METAVSPSSSSMCPMSIRQLADLLSGFVPVWHLRVRIIRYNLRCFGLSPNQSALSNCAEPHQALSAAFRPALLPYDIFPSALIAFPFLTRPDTSPVFIPWIPWSDIYIRSGERKNVLAPQRSSTFTVALSILWILKIHLFCNKIYVITCISRLILSPLTHQPLAV